MSCSVGGHTASSSLLNHSVLAMYINYPVPSSVLISPLIFLIDLIHVLSTGQVQAPDRLIPGADSNAQPRTGGRGWAGCTPAAGKSRQQLLLRLACLAPPPPAQLRQLCGVARLKDARRRAHLRPPCRAARGGRSRPARAAASTGGGGHGPGSMRSRDRRRTGAGSTLSGHADEPPALRKEGSKALGPGNRRCS